MRSLMQRRLPELVLSVSRPGLAAQAPVTWHGNSKATPGPKNSGRWLVSSATVNPSRTLWENEMTRLNVRLSPALRVMPVSCATLVKYPPPGAAEMGTYSLLMSSGAPPSTARVVVCAFRKA